MIAELNLEGKTYRMQVPNKIFTRLIICPRKMLDNLPLIEIEEYVRQRKEMHFK